MKNLMSVIFLLCVALGCNNSTKVGTGTTQSNTAAPSSSNGTRRITINQSKTFAGLEVTIGEIALEKGKITVGMTLRNPTKDTITCYPNQGHLVIGKHQLKSNMFMDSGDLGGEIHAGVEKQGSLAFLDTDNLIDPATVKQVDFKLGRVFGKDFMKSAEMDWLVSLQ